MRLSPHFTLSELTRSEAATRGGFSNAPSAEATENLKALCEVILEPVRAHFGKPIRVNSGYRGPQANAAVGGATSSQHCKGEAADFEIDSVANRDLVQAIVDLNLSFDQLILEFHVAGDPNSGWVHCSHKRNGINRHEVLTATKVQGKTVYSKGLPG
jgi:hypothetical protein